MKSEVTPFVFVGNNIAIDFVNTEIMSRGVLIDLLQDDEDLVQWAHEAGLNLKNRLNATDLPATLELRQALRVICLARIDRLPAPRKALAILNQHLANHSTHQALKCDKDNNEYALIPAQDALTIPVLLANLAYEGAKLLASPQAAQLKHCSNAECVLIFKDTSRGQKRRWCSMDLCGNRAKVATHYRNNLTR